MGTSEAFRNISAVTLILYDSFGICGLYFNSNIQKYFLSPIPMDVTTDFLACKILQSLRESFKDEIYQIAVVQKRQNIGPSTGGPGTQIKQQEKYVVNSGQITFVTR